MEQGENPWRARRCNRGLKLLEVDNPTSATAGAHSGGKAQPTDDPKARILAESR